MPTALDHALVAALVLLLPAYSAWAYPIDCKRIREGGSPARKKWYWQTIAVEWILLFALAANWVCNHRPFHLLGLRLVVDWKTWLVAAFTALAIIGLYAQLRSIRQSPRLRQQVIAKMDFVHDVMPRTPSELHIWLLLALTAGVCEELLYRGFLIWYSSAYMPAWAALLASSAAFGFAHAYQGTSGILKTGVVGLISGLMYLLSGSLWLPMMLHAAVDFNAGQISKTALSPQPYPAP